MNKNFSIILHYEKFKESKEMRIDKITAKYTFKIFTYLLIDNEKTGHYII